MELDGDPEVMRHLTGGRPTPLPVVRDELLPPCSTSTTAAGLLGSLLAPGLGRWAAVDRLHGTFLGWFALDPPPDSAADRTQAELGYRLRRSAWGSGLATEGSRALVRSAFARLGLRRVWTQTMAVTVRSRRVMEKAGLRHVRTFHLTWEDPIPGYEHGEVEYQISHPGC